MCGVEVRLWRRLKYLQFPRAAASRRGIFCQLVFDSEPFFWENGRLFCLSMRNRINMLKSKVKKAAPKAAPLKASRKRAGRPTAISQAETKSNPRSNGAPHQNGSSNGASNGHHAAPAESGAAEPRLDAGSIKTKSGVDLTEKVREL